MILFMSPEEDTQSQIQSQIKTVAELAPWLKALIIGAFMFGSWVATLEVRVTQLNRDMGTLSTTKKERDDKFDEWQDTVIKESTEVKSELKGLREDIVELKESLREKK